MDLHSQEQMVLKTLPSSWIAGVAIAIDDEPFLSVRVLPGLKEAARERLERAGLPGPYEVVGPPKVPRVRNPALPTEPVPPYNYPVEPPIPGEQLVGEVEGLLDRAGLLYDGGPRAQVWLWDALDEEHAKNPRRYAQVIPGWRRFEFARATLQLPYCHRLGLMAHEVGHVLKPDLGETGCDRIAYDILGVKIGYDRRWPGKGLQFATNC